MVEVNATSIVKRRCKSIGRTVDLAFARCVDDILGLDIGSFCLIGFRVVILNRGYLPDIWIGSEISNIRLAGDNNRLTKFVKPASYGPLFLVNRAIFGNEGIVSITEISPKNIRLINCLLRVHLSIEQIIIKSPHADKTNHAIMVLRVQRMGKTLTLAALE